MEEYALNSFSDIASKDPVRLLDLGNDAQILYDMISGNANWRNFSCGLRQAD